MRSNQANAYGVLKDLPTLPLGSVTIPVVFHIDRRSDAFTATEHGAVRTR